MSTDTLTLGPFEFTDFSVPERMPFGGRQQMHIHRMPGGTRVIDCMGPDDIDRIWSGILWGDSALGDALTLDAMRKAGESLIFSNGIETREVVILEFFPKVRKLTCIEYDIAVVVTDSSEGAAGGSGFLSIASQVGADVASAIGLF